LLGFPRFSVVGGRYACAGLAGVANGRLGSDGRLGEARRDVDQMQISGSVVSVTGRAL
jgi:hypothetical protein